MRETNRETISPRRRGGSPLTPPREELKRLLLDLLDARAEPVTVAEAARSLGLTPGCENTVRSALAELIGTGEVERVDAARKRKRPARHHAMPMLSYIVTAYRTPPAGEGGAA